MDRWYSPYPPPICGMDKWDSPHPPRICGMDKWDSPHPPRICGMDRWDSPHPPHICGMDKWDSPHPPRICGMDRWDSRTPTSHMWYEQMGFHRTHLPYVVWTDGIHHIYVVHAPRCCWKTKLGFAFRNQFLLNKWVCLSELPNKIHACHARLGG